MAPRRRLTAADFAAVFALTGRRGGATAAANMSKRARIERARKAGQASGGWPKGKKRGPSPLKGRKVTR